MPLRQRMTVIVIPETGRRTLSFRFTSAWLVLLAGIVTGLSLVSYAQYRHNQSLTVQLEQLSLLTRTNRLQEAEIDALRTKLSETDQKLAELQQLETQLRELAGQAGAPSRGGDSSEITPVHTSGRGGPDRPTAVPENLPTLGAMLPPEVRAYLFAPRDTLAMDLQVPTSRQAQPATVLATAAAMRTQADQQMQVMEQLAADMKESKKAIQDRMDYIAHRPTGLPISGGLFTDRFGWRWNPFGGGQQFHEGLDIASDYGIPVVATADGVIIYSGWDTGGLGNTVRIDHGYGFVTVYGHLSSIKYAVGKEVSRGDVIGRLGSTGNSTGPHVHYEVHVNGTAADPVKYLQ